MGRTSHLVRVTNAIAMLMMASIANAESDSMKKKDDHEWIGWIKDEEMAFRISMDPLFRTIVCRVAYTDVSSRILAKAARATLGRIMIAVDDLERMGLFRWDPQHPFVANIVPTSNLARETMRRWADAWCSGDDKCDVQQ